MPFHLANVNGTSRFIGVPLYRRAKVYEIERSVISVKLAGSSTWVFALFLLHSVMADESSADVRARPDGHGCSSRLVIVAGATFPRDQRVGIKRVITRLGGSLGVPSRPLRGGF